jgi:hypothetical protein
MAPKSHEFPYILFRKPSNYILGAFAERIAAENYCVSVSLFPAEQRGSQPKDFLDIFVRNFH